jgi:isopenicillin N synthase-like dioxygenase
MPLSVRPTSVDAPSLDLVFRERCWALAYLVAAFQMEKQDAVDRLQQAAEAYGFVSLLGQQAVQDIMSAAFRDAEA